MQERACELSRLMWFDIWKLFLSWQRGLLTRGILRVKSSGDNSFPSATYAEIH